MAKKKSKKLRKTARLNLPRITKQPKPTAISETPVDVKIDIPKPEKYTCPTSMVDYTGMCPITRCPANVSHLARKSGCVYNFLHGKQELTAIELSYVFKLDVKVTKKIIEEGEEAIQRVLLLNKILSRARETIKVTSYCDRCGVLRTSYGNCINTVKCDERLELTKPLLTRYPFDLEELHITNKDIFLLLHNRTKINAYLKVFDKPNRRIRFSNILSLSNAEVNTLRELNTLV